MKKDLKGKPSSVVRVPEEIQTDRVRVELPGGQVLVEVISDTLQLRDMSISEIKDKLDVLPGKVAYWKSMSAEIAHAIEEQQQGYDIWYAKVYSRIDEDEKKMTESAKKNKVILDNEEEYDTRQRKLMSLRLSQGKSQAIVKGFETMAWTLTTLASLARAELGALNPEARGRGNLNNE